MTDDRNALPGLADFHCLSQPVDYDRRVCHGRREPWLHRLNLAHRRSVGRATDPGLAFLQLDSTVKDCAASRRGASLVPARWRMPAWSASGEVSSRRVSVQSHGQHLLDAPGRLPIQQMGLPARFTTLAQEIECQRHDARRVGAGQAG